MYTVDAFDTSETADLVHVIKDFDIELGVDITKGIPSFPEETAMVTNITGFLPTLQVDVTQAKLADIMKIAKIVVLPMVTAIKNNSVLSSVSAVKRDVEDEGATEIPEKPETQTTAKFGVGVIIISLSHTEDNPFLFLKLRHLNANFSGSGDVSVISAELRRLVIEYQDEDVSRSLFNTGEGMDLMEACTNIQIRQ